MSRRDSAPPTHSAVVKRIRTKFTRNTFAFCAFVCAVWYAALSQGNGAAYALFFLIAALGLLSWVHGRRNLRGLSFQAGRVDPVFAGGELHVPITVTAGAGNFAAGLEIRALSGRQPVTCGFLAAGQTTNLRLEVPATRRGMLAELEIEIRSIWPLGFFSTEARVTLPAPHTVHPNPAGSQPLPEGEAGWQYDRKKGRGDGDEFAGLRDFRAGESPRRIHWRAAERSDRLLIKEWEGASGGVRWLEWDAVDAVATEARIAQLTRWVLDADRSGVPYGLRLPGHEIIPAMGPAQRARCLDALAAVPGKVETTPPRKRPRQPEPAILPGPFAVLLVALGLAALPIATTVIPFSAGLLGLAILFRFFTRDRGLALRATPLKLVFCGIAVGGVLLSSGTLVGLGPGMSLLVSLFALKTLESTSRRDFFVLLLLTWFLALCGLFVSQTLPAGLAAIAFCLAAAGSALVLYSEARLPWRRATKRLGLMTMQTLPIVVLLFLFFPRIQGGFRPFPLGGTGAAGFSEDFDPSGFTKLNENFDTAFRAEFLDGEPPAPPDRYWRGLVLWNCEGFQWRRGAVRTLEPRVTQPPEGSFRQRITLQPHGARWLFALDRPLYSIRDATLEAGAYLQSFRPVNRTTRYEVLSLPNPHDDYLPKEQRTAALDLPSKIPPQTRKLGESFRETGPGADARTLNRALDWFRAQHFTYSLSPNQYQGAAAMDDFLFQRRTGFCSHYAASFALLMRIAGVPSRVILGFQGGEYNPHGSYFLVRQNDAHSWAEVWIEGRGWVRADLTSALAPGRLETGAERFRESAATGFAANFKAPPGLSNLIDGVRMVWDNMNYQWDLRVVAYDDDAQFEILANLGLKDLPGPVMIGSIFGLTFIFLGIAGLWLRGVTRSTPPPVVKVWSKACRQIERLTGLERDPWEGPQAYATRAATARPGAASAIQAVADLYTRIRFGPNPPPLTDLQAAISELKRQPKG